MESCDLLLSSSFLPPSFAHMSFLSRQQQASEWETPEEALVHSLSGGKVLARLPQLRKERETLAGRHAILVTQGQEDRRRATEMGHTTRDASS